MITARRVLTTMWRTFWLPPVLLGSLVLAVRAEDPQPDPQRSGSGSPVREKPITAEDREHWAFIAPRRPEVPEVTKPDWVRNPIDAFVLAKHEENRLRPAPEADR